MTVFHRRLTRLYSSRLTCDRRSSTVKAEMLITRPNSEVI